MEGELHCHETWISLWTVDAAVAAAVFQIALNSQRLCEMNEWMDGWMVEWMNVGVIFQATVQYLDRVESTAAGQ